MEVRFGELARNHTLLRERPHHARAHVQAGIRGGQHRREHHEIHDVAGERHADRLEHEHERARVDARLVPRNQRRHDGDRADEEDRQTQHGGVHGLRNRLGRVLRLARRDADHFGAGEGEHDRQQRGENRQHAVGQPAVAVEVLEHGRVVIAGDRNRAEHGQQANDDERDDGEHLDGREPEFRFAVQAHRQDVEQEHDHDERGRPDPCGRMREPALHQQARGGEFGGERHRPIQPVEHGDGERGAGADETLRIQVEAAGVRHGHRQLAEAQHDEVDEQRTDGVRDDRAERARLMDGVAGA